MRSGMGCRILRSACGKVSADRKTYAREDSVVVRMTLSNTGDRAGAETVQLYVGQCRPSVVRPVKELKAFRKVFLQPGESREIRFGLPVADFAFYDEKSTAGR